MARNYNILNCNRGATACEFAVTVAMVAVAMIIPIHETALRLSDSLNDASIALQTESAQSNQQKSDGGDSGESTGMQGGGTQQEVSSRPGRPDGNGPPSEELNGPSPSLEPGGNQASQTYTATGPSTTYY